MSQRWFLFLPWAILGADLAGAQHGPGHVACEFKWIEAGKPADYTGFMEKCLPVQPLNPSPTLSPAQIQRATPLPPPQPPVQQTTQARQIEKYHPPLTPSQLAHPSNMREHFLVALSAYDEDLVSMAWSRFLGTQKQMLEWLEKAQQQRDVNDINRTKALIYPAR